MMIAYKTSFHFLRHPHVALRKDMQHGKAMHLSTFFPHSVLLLGGPFMVLRNKEAIRMKQGTVRRRLAVVRGKRQLS